MERQTWRKFTFSPFHSDKVMSSPPWYMNMFGLKHAGNRDVCGETATVVSLPVQSGPTLDVDGVLAYIAHIAKGAFRGKKQLSYWDFP